jgi:hypothetical protein
MKVRPSARAQRRLVTISFDALQSLLDTRVRIRLKPASSKSFVGLGMEVKLSLYSKMRQGVERHPIVGNLLRP